MKKSSLIKYLMLLFMLILITQGCSTKIRGWSHEAYRSDDFDTAMFEKKGLAILPVIILKETCDKRNKSAGQISLAPYAPQTISTNNLDENGSLPNTHEAYRTSLSEMLFGKLNLKYPDFKILSPGTSLKILNDNELTTVYDKFDRNFSRMGIDQKILTNFGKALKCRYIFIGQAVVLKSKSEASLSIVWSFGHKSMLRSVKIYGQIWDMVDGRHIWEGSGVGYNMLPTFGGESLFEFTASKAIDSLLDNLSIN